MPEWIHNRERHIKAHNPSMPESEAFAIATQQAHATGHTPKGFGTAKGKAEAKAKYPNGSEYKQTANPSHKSKSSSAYDSALWMGFQDELAKIAAAKPSTLTSQPKMTARPVVKEPDLPGSTQDHISSSRTIQPPPVTSGVY
jgi:hypothetical protein